jgi:hypothetical protein
MTSSAREPSLDALDDNVNLRSRRSTSSSARTENLESRPSTTTLSSFHPQSPVQAPLQTVAAKVAGRQNAKLISKSEVQALEKERHTLLDRLFDGTITRKEKHRLEYVRWSLDRVDDALMGEDLDKLDGAVEVYERLSSDLQKLADQLSQIAHKRR